MTETTKILPRSMQVRGARVHNLKDNRRILVFSNMS